MWALFCFCAMTVLVISVFLLTAMALQGAHLMACSAFVELSAVIQGFKMEKLYMYFTKLVSYHRTLLTLSDY